MAKRHTAEIHIQATNDHSEAFINQILHNRDDLLVKELGFINSNQSDIIFKKGGDICDVLDRKSIILISGVMIALAPPAIASMDSPVCRLRQARCTPIKDEEQAVSMIILGPVRL